MYLEDTHSLALRHKDAHAAHEKNGDRVGSEEGGKIDLDFISRTSLLRSAKRGGLSVENEVRKKLCIVSYTGGGHER